MKNALTMRILTPSGALSRSPDLHLLRAEFLLLMTFASSSEKADTVARLAELRFDTSDFDNSPRVQVEQVRAAPAPPSTPAPPIDESAPSSEPQTASPAPQAAVPPKQNTRPAAANSSFVGEAGKGAYAVRRTRAVEGEGSGHALEEQLRRNIQQGLQAKRLIAAAAAAAKAKAKAEAEVEAKAAAAASAAQAVTTGDASTSEKEMSNKAVKTGMVGARKSDVALTTLEDAAVATRDFVGGRRAASPATASSLTPQHTPGAVSSGRGSTVKAAPALGSKTDNRAAAGQSSTDAKASRSSLSTGPRREGRAPSPVATEEVAKAVASALATPRSDGRSSSPTMPTMAVSNPQWKATQAVNRSAITPLKAMHKRLIVVPPAPSDPPDPTKRKWNFGFDGPYFKLFDRDRKTGEALRCDPSKNWSYIGVTPPLDVLVSGLREMANQKKSATTAATTTTTPGAVPRAVSPPATAVANSAPAVADITARSSSAGSRDTHSDAGSTAGKSEGAQPGGSKGPVADSSATVATAEKHLGIPSSTGISSAPATMPPATTAGSQRQVSPPAAVVGRSSTVDSGSSVRPVVAGMGDRHDISSREIVGSGGGDVKTPRLQGRALAVRISEVQKELRLLQKNSIPRFVSASTSVCWERKRHIERLICPS